MQIALTRESRTEESAAPDTLVVWADAKEWRKLSRYLDAHDPNVDLASGRPRRKLLRFDVHNVINDVLVYAVQRGICNVEFVHEVGRRMTDEDVPLGFRVFVLGDYRFKFGPFKWGWRGSFTHRIAPSASQPQSPASS